MIKLIKNANIISHSTNGVYDVLIEDDKISKIEKNIEADADEIIIAEGKTLIPGLIDMHVHFRQPGFDHRETLETGSLAALHGGVTTVGMMPNTKPAIDNSIMIEYIQNKAKELDLINILPIGAITKGREGKELAGMQGMTDKGAIAFSDDGAPVYDPNIMYRAAQYSLMTKRPLINHAEVPELAKGNMREGETSCKIGVYGIPEIAESIMVARDIEISKYTGAHVHIAHVSTSQTVDLLKYSKMQDLKVTSEVTHNHLLLNEEACESYSTDTKINPPLPDKKSQKALIEAIKDNTIDMIVSDHAPYAKYEKEVEFEAAPTGISGIETLLSGIIKLSKEQKINLKSLIEKVTYNPAKIFDLKNIGDIKQGYNADIVIVDTEREWEVTETSLKSKGKNTPFLNTFMPGVVEKVFVNGKIKYEEKELIK